MTFWQLFCEVFWICVLGGAVGAVAVNGAVWVWNWSRRERWDRPQVDEIVAKTRQEHLDTTPRSDWKNVTAADVKEGGSGYANCETAIPTIGTAAIPTKTIAVCEHCLGSTMRGERPCRFCAKHIRPLPYTLNANGAVLSNSLVMTFARAVGPDRIARWCGSERALRGLGGPIFPGGPNTALLGKPIHCADYSPDDRLYAYDSTGEWTGQIIHIGAPITPEEVASEAGKAPRKSWPQR